MCMYIYICIYICVCMYIYMCDNVCVLVIYIYIYYTMYSSNFSCANIKYLHIWPDVRTRTLSFCLSLWGWGCIHGWAHDCAFPARCLLTLWSSRLNSFTCWMRKAYEGLWSKNYKCNKAPRIQMPSNCPCEVLSVLSIWPFLELLVSSAGLHRPSRGPNAWKTRREAGLVKSPMLHCSSRWCGCNLQSPKFGSWPSELCLQSILVTFHEI